MAGVHSTFGPSSAHRIRTCPASYSLHQSQTSSYAVQGTAAHDIHEKLLKHPEIPASHYLGQTIIVHEGEEKFEVEVDQPMLNAVQDSVDKVKDLIASIEAEFIEPKMYVEIRVDISEYTPVPDQLGTSDVIIVAGSTVHVIDYKHGAGVVVQAYDNEQMTLYALGAIKTLKLEGIEDVFMHIHQPNAENYDTWHNNLLNLQAYGREIKREMARALEPEPPFGPEEKACRFCSVKPVCPALAAKVQQLYIGVFDDMTALDLENKIPLAEIPAPEFKLMSSDDLAAAWRARSLVEMWVEAVKNECEARLLAHEPVAGLKLVHGRSSRSWKDEKAAANYLLQTLAKRDVYSVSMISPAEAEKKLPKAARAPLADLVTKKPGNPTVALESDKRAEFKPGHDAFDDYTVLDTSDGL